MQTILSYVYFLPSPSPSFRIRNLTGDVNDDRDIIDVRMNECWRRIKDWKKRRKKKKSERTLTYWDRRAPDGRGVSACLSVGVALERLPSKFSPPPASRVTLFPSQSTPSLAEEAFGGGSVMAGRSRRFQDPGIGRGRASTPEPTLHHRVRNPLRGERRARREGRGGEEEARTRYNWRRCRSMLRGISSEAGRYVPHLCKRGPLPGGGEKKRGESVANTREREGPLPSPSRFFSDDYFELVSEVL